MINNLGRVLTTLAEEEARILKMYCEIDPQPNVSYELLRRGIHRRMAHVEVKAEIQAGCSLTDLKKEALRRGGVEFAGGRISRSWGRLVTQLLVKEFLRVDVN